MRMINFYIGLESYDTDEIISIDRFSTWSLIVYMLENRQHIIPLYSEIPEECDKRFEEVTERYKKAVETREKGLEDDAMREQYKIEELAKLGIKIKSYIPEQIADYSAGPEKSPKDEYGQGSLF